MRGIAIAALLMAGIAAGYGLKTHFEPRTEQGVKFEDPAEIARLRENSEKYEILKKKLGLIADDDLEDYLHLKDLETKYKKADDILAKITLIFLADLGIHLSDQEKKFAEHPETAHAAIPVKPSPVPSTRLSPGTPTDWRLAERNLHYLKSGEAEWFLKKTQIADFASELSKSAPLQARNLWLEGCFSGAVHLNDGRVWQMRTEISFQEGTPLTANTSVQLTENGRLFSNSSGSGSVTDLRTFGTPSSAIILEASDSRYFQMYPTADQSMLVGNLYLRGTDPQSFDFKGTALLERQACAGG